MLALDTSALVKRYLLEPGRERVLDAMARDPQWAGSALTRAEATIALCRRDERHALDPLAHDWRRFVVVDADEAAVDAAARIGCDLGIGTLDALHLAAALALPPPVTFLTFDARQRDAAATLGLDLAPT